MAGLTSSNSRAFGSGSLEASSTQHWNQRDQSEEESQTEALDSMRRMQVLFNEAIDAVRVEVESAQENAREKLAEWEQTHRRNIWVWDAAAECLRDAEARSRCALVDSEGTWRDTFLVNAFELVMMDR